MSKELLAIWEQDKELFPGPRGVETPGGWDGLVVAFLNEFSRLEGAATAKVFCIKEKFGELRAQFYTQGEIDRLEFDKLERKYVLLSREICTVCGKAGTMRNEGWRQPLCDLHAKKEGTMEAKKEVKGGEETQVIAN